MQPATTSQTPSWLRSPAGLSMEEDNNMQNIELSKPASGALARDAGEVSPPPTSTSLSMQDIELTDAKSAASETGAGPSGCLERFSDAVNGRLERGFAALGSFVGRRPRLTIVLSILVALLLTAGVVRLENETRGDKLWIPSGTQAKVDNEYVEDNYARFARTEIFRIVADDKGSVLTPAAFDAALEVHLASIGTVWTDTEQVWNASQTPAAAYGWTDVCLSAQQTRGAADPLDCIANNILELFSYDPTKWATEQLLLATLNDPSSWNRELAGGGIVLSSIVGDLQRNTDGLVTSGRALSFSYLLYEDAWYIDEQEEYKLATGWEQEWLDTMQAENERLADYEVVYFAGRSFDDEFGDSISNDVILLQVAIAAIGIYTMIQLSRCRDNFVGARITLTLLGLLAIGFAIGSTYGFCSLIGIIFSPLMTVLPLYAPSSRTIQAPIAEPAAFDRNIMIGIGVDSVFILVATFDNTDAELSIEERLAETLRTGGVSITLAAFTNFGAFIIGSNTSLPALQAFSIYAAFGLLFDWMFQITFFSACIVLDARRMQARRCDVLCCVKSKAKPEKGILCGACGDGVPQKPVLQQVMRQLGRMLTLTPVRIVVLLVGAGMLGAGIYGTSQMKVDADVNDFIPGGSYLRDYVDVDQDYFTSTGPRIGVYFVDTKEVPIDFSAPATWAQMDEAAALTVADPWVIDNSIDLWIDSLRAFSADQGSPLTQGSFYTDLTAFLATPFGRLYQGNIVFYNAAVPAEGIKTARLTATWQDLDNSRQEVSAMNSIRTSILDLPSPLGANAFAFGASFLQTEQYKKIGQEALLNIGLACLMVAFVVVILLANPLAAVLTLSSVIIVIVEVVGFMHWWGFTIDSITVIFLVIGLGLSIDYAVHVAHGYLANQNPDPDQRIITTMEATGSAVLHGAVSTFLAAICLSGSGSYVFFTFFCALFLVVLLGMFQGLLVLPVLLGLTKPRPHFQRS